MNTILLIWCEELTPEYDLEFFESRDAAIEREKELIALIGRRDLEGPLTNLTSGGDGLIEPTEAVRRRIGLATKKRLSDPSVLKKLMKKRREFFCDPENRAKLAESIRLAYQNNPELLERNRRVQKIVQNHPEVAEKKSLAMKDYWSISSWAEKVKKAQRHDWTPEKRKANSEQKKRWVKKNPVRMNEMAKKRNKTLQTTEYRKKRSKLTKKQMQDPAMRRRFIESAKTPEAIEKFKKSRAQTMQHRMAIKDECKRLIGEYGIDITAPDGRAAVAVWENFLEQLRQLVKKID